MKISDLLPIPSETREPHPYQVFGLNDGEQDPVVIAAAIKSAVAHLTTVKSRVDPQVWRRAADLVKQAHETLSDSSKKAELDARFGIITIDPAPAIASLASDGLAAFLPTGDPLASVDPDPVDRAPVDQAPVDRAPVDQAPVDRAPRETAAGEPVPVAHDPLPPPPPEQLADAVAKSPPVARVAVGDRSARLASPDIPVNPMPPGLFGTPPGSLADTSTKPPQLAPTASMKVRPPRPRRKRLIPAPVLFLFFALIMIALIGGVIFFAISNPAKVAITMTDDGVSISTQPDREPQTPIVGQPRAIDQSPVGVGPRAPRREAPPKDPIMGRLGRDETAAPLGVSSGLARSLTESLAGEGPPETEVDGETTEASEVESMVMESPAAESTTVPAMQQDPQVGPAPDPQPVTSQPVTDEMIVAAEAQLQQVRTLIRSANWKEMKPAAEAVTKLPMSAEQMEEAQSLFELADLASYYRVGIERAVNGLESGGEIQIGDRARVAVVETGPDLLVIRHRGGNRPYRLDELPWSLAHTLASHEITDSPTAQAAKAVYQAIAPLATEAYRSQSLDWLSEISGEVEGADPQRLAQTILRLFKEP